MPRSQRYIVSYLHASDLINLQQAEVSYVLVSVYFIRNITKIYRTAFWMATNIKFRFRPICGGPG